MTIDEQLRAALERVDEDDSFAEWLDADTAAALREAGFEDLSTAVEVERDRIAELREEIFADDEFRSRVEDDLTALTDRGIPEDALEPVLFALGAPDDLVARAEGDVEAHGATGKTLTVAATAAALGAFAFAGQASAAKTPDPTGWTGAEAAAKAPVGFRWTSVDDTAARPNPRVSPNPWVSPGPRPSKRSAAAWLRARNLRG